MQHSRGIPVLLQEVGIFPRALGHTPDLPQHWDLMKLQLEAAALLSTSSETEEVAGQAKPGMSLGTFQEDFCLEKPLQVGSSTAAAGAKPWHPSYFNLPSPLAGQGDREAALHTQSAAKSTAF